MVTAHPSMLVRIAVGKSVGFLFGLAVMVAMPWIWPDADWYFRIGLLLWYTTFGAIIGIFGVMTRHPTLNLPLHWWIRAPLVGAWLNFVLLLFTHQAMRTALESMLGAQSGLTSPFWFVAEGAVVGLAIGFLTTRFGGEGPDTILKDEMQND